MYNTNDMMVAIFLIVNMLVAVALVVLAIISLLHKGYRYSLNRIFASFSFAVAIWIIDNYLSNSTHIPIKAALYANYLTYALGFAALLLFTRFVAAMTGNRRLKRILHFSMAPLCIICVLSATPLLVTSIEPQGEDVYGINFGLFFIPYIITLLYMICLVAFGLFKGLRHSRGMRLRQLKSISLGVLLSIPLIMIFGFLIPALTGSFVTNQFGIVPMIALVASLYYGVVRYRLFDIKLAVARVVVYAMVLSVLSLIYYGLAYLISNLFLDGQVNLSVGVSPINIGLALLLAFIFQPVKHFFDRITNKFFYKSGYETDDFVNDINHTLASTNDLRRLLERTAEEISGTIKSEQAFFYVNTRDGHYICAGTQGHNKLSEGEVKKINELKDDSSDIIITSLLNHDDKLHRLLSRQRIELVLPLLQRDKLLGYLCLGDHLASGYTGRDSKALKMISSELVIAIQNALAVKEIRDLNSTLKQRIGVATKELRASNAVLRQLDKVKDEFVGMASHQLRTPLTSVKGYLSMVLEGDAGKISSNQREFLTEAYESSERMVGLINDFLNVSRLQTGKFVIEKTQVDLSKVVSQEIGILKPNAEARKLHYEYNAPNDFPIITADEGKLRQVIMNFADNALYYSHENSTTIITLAIDGNDIVYTVKDRGIGVPADEQSKLFTKFFRATNARRQRPDGTGVGLYLAKKIIEAHGGKIIFESVENKGSTFGFRLSLSKVST